MYCTAAISYKIELEILLSKIIITKIHSQLLEENFEG